MHLRADETPERMEMRLKSLFAITVICAVAVFACGDDGSAEDSAATETDAQETAEAEQAYLDAVAEARRLTQANFKEFETLFNQVWPLPFAMFDALKRAGVGTAFAEEAAAIEKLRPPPRYSADHQVLLTRVQEWLSLDREVGEAVANEDVTAFAVANAALGQATMRAALRLSVDVCNALNVSDDEVAARACMRPDEGEGGDYGL